MTKVLTPQFVEFISEVLEDGKLYISLTYQTAAHKCCCGCQQRVVTPLSATGWSLSMDGEYVSLYPSIGNWSFPCQSHYWIRRNEVHWSYQMSRDEIETSRRFDARLKKDYYETGDVSTDPDTLAPGDRQADYTPPDDLWNKLKKWLFG